MNRRVQGVAVACVVLLSLAGCGGGEKVGDAFKDFKGDKAGDRLGEVQQSAAPKATPKPNTSTSKTPVPVQKTAAPEEPQQSSLNVKIASTGFDPTAAKIYAGSLVTVTNTDTKPHSYQSSDLTYDTGSLAAGASKTFSADTTGNFQMEDATRNWIHGTLEVVAS